MNTFSSIPHSRPVTHIASHLPARTALTLFALLMSAALISACSSSDTPMESQNGGDPAASSPTQITETVVASSTDGILFDIRLSGSLHDSDGDGSFRDEVEIVSPGATEFQGHFPSPEGDLVIFSCFDPVCQGPQRSAEFTVRYWALAG